MPDLYQPEKDRTTKAMTVHNYKYTTKHSKTLPKNCINVWNNLTVEIKSKAYIDCSTIKHFTGLAKAYIIQNY